MTKYSVSPINLCRNLIAHRHLIIDLAKRDALGKYRGSRLGILWSLLNPIMMLTIYTFVFSEIFQARWNAAGPSKSEFAIILFIGLILFNLFSENVSRAPLTVVHNENFVKKIIFPLEVFQVVNLLSSLFHMSISLLILLAFQLLIMGTIPMTIFYLPVIIGPLLLMSLGFSWFLAAMGVFLRDIAQTVSLIMTGLMFLSPIFFPISSIPEKWQKLASLNPLVFPIEQARNVQIWGKLPELNDWLIYTAAAALVAWLGFATFQKTRRGFADVL